MSEVSQYTRHGASKITPRILKDLMHKLPLLKVEFTQIHAPKFPHLVDQLEFLADVVEDVMEDAYLDLPYEALAMASFALIYVHKQMDLIPDTLPEWGLLDDSLVVRATLMANERDFQAYAAVLGFDWKTVTTQP
ncbi:MAG: DUF1232 domain-containing protein [Verrucomicrobiota bacterium]